MQQEEVKEEEKLEEVRVENSDDVEITMDHKLQAFEWIKNLLCVKLGLPKGSEIPEDVKQAFLNQEIPEEEDTRYMKKAVKGPIKVGKALS